MFDLFVTILRVLFCGFQSHHQLLLENLALRHQLTVLQRSVPRAKLKRVDRFLWVCHCVAGTKAHCPRSPWQNPMVERLIGSLRRECSGPRHRFNEKHLRRILARTI